MKVAIFVEGATELIFIRNSLLNLYYSREMAVSLNCLKIHGGVFTSVPYDIPNGSPLHHFQIINCQGDTNVLSFIIENEKGLFQDGFDLIIGLRDMYSQQYKDKAGAQKVVDPALNQKFIQGSRSQIDAMTSRPDDIHLVYSIMEVEAWFLAMDEVLTRVSGNKYERASSVELIFHPFQALADHCSGTSAGSRFDYDKSESCVESLTQRIEVKDIVNLYLSKESPSFNEFLEKLPDFSQLLVA